MSTSQVRNVEYLMVGAQSGDAPTANEAISDLAEGEIGVFSVDGLRRAATDTDARFKIVVGGANGQPFFVSDVIPSTGLSISTSQGVAATEQQDSIGFNGTSGSIDDQAPDAVLFQVAVYVQEYLTSNTDGRYIKHFQYQSGSTDSQADIAAGLLKSAIHNFSKEAERYIVFEMLINDAGGSLVGAGAITFTYGSKTISAATDITLLAVNDFIRVGTGLTDECYKVVAIDAASNTATLDVAYQGASQTLADTAVEVITAVNAAAADCGLLMTGLPLSSVRGKEFYKKARWELSLKNFGNTNQVREANADKGAGTYEEILQKEFFLEGFKGEYHRKGEPTIHPLAENALESDAPYEITTISWEDSHVVGFTGNVSPKQLTLATPSALANTLYMSDGTAGVFAVLAGLTGLTVTDPTP